jgi:hypothetical protein
MSIPSGNEVPYLDPCKVQYFVRKTGRGLDKATGAHLRTLRTSPKLKEVSTRGLAVGARPVKDGNLSRCT